LSDYKKSETNLNEKEKKAIQVLSRIVNAIAEGAEVEKVFSDQDYTLLEISKVDPGIIIGKHGHTLDAIQYLVNMITSKKEEDESQQRLFVIDIDGYRKRREESLKKYAKEKAEVAKKKGDTVALYFMNSIERRLVHLSLQEDPEVATYSEGKEPFRRVIISPTTISKRNYQQKDDE
jgi:spoIIIJ-associated protein